MVFRRKAQRTFLHPNLFLPSFFIILMTSDIIHSMGDLPCPDIRAVNTILTIGGSPLFCKYYVYPIKETFYA